MESDHGRCMAMKNCSQNMVWGSEFCQNWSFDHLAIKGIQRRRGYAAANQRLFVEFRKPRCHLDDFWRGAYEKKKVCKTGS